MANDVTATSSAAAGYRLADLIDLSLLQKMVEAHYRAAGMPMGIIDAVGGSVLVSAGWQDICLQFHRANPVSRRRCEASDRYIQGHLAEGKPCAYKCANGLWDIGIPIIVEGRHLATVFLGQFFYEGEEPDREFFKRQAREFDYDTSGYLAALDRVPVFKHEKVDYILAYDRALAGFIADLAEHALERIRTDRELRYANAVLKAQQENSPDGILVVDDRQKMISFNRKFVDMWQIPDRIVRSRSNDDALRWIERFLVRPGEFIALVRRVNEHLDRESFDEIRLRDGRVFEQHSAPMFGKEGAYYGRVWHFRDITDRKNAVSALRESEQRFATFFNLSPVAMTIATLHDGLIYEVNGSFEKLFGVPRNEALEHTTIEVGIYGNADERERLIRAVQEQGGVHDFEIHMKNRAGRDIAALVSSTVIFIGQKPYLLTAGIDITERKRAEKVLRESFEKTQRSLEGVINAITTIVETRDPYTAGHQKRVSRLACAIAEEMGLSGDRIAGLRIGAILHDVGKIYVPAEILAKPGRLSPVEMDIVKAHPQESYDILKMIDFPWPVAEIAFQHQERFNGTGYPRGLADGDILLEARILAVADTVEAMMIQRPYRPAVGMDNALDLIMKGRGTDYDPGVVDAAVRLFRERHFSFASSGGCGENVLSR